MYKIIIFVFLIVISLHNVNAANVNIDYSNPITSIDYYYGTNEATYEIYFKGSSQIQQYHKDIGDDYIRIWVMNHTEIYIENGEFVYLNENNFPYDCVSYNFTKLDQYIEIIINKVGAKPFITFESSPDCMSYSGRGSLPKDFTQFASVLGEILNHYNSMYNTNDWYVAIWNEPWNKTLFWGSDNNYTKIYNEAYTKIKQVNPNIKVGGFVLYYLQSDRYYENELRNFLENANGLDFIELHHYGISGFNGNVNDNDVLIDHTKKLYYDETNYVINFIKQYRNDNPKIVIGEMNVNGLHDVRSTEQFGAAWYASALNWLVRNNVMGTYYSGTGLNNRTWTYGMWMRNGTTFPVYDMTKLFTKYNKRGSSIYNSNSDDNFIEILPVNNRNNYYITLINKKNSDVNVNINVTGLNFKKYIDLKNNKELSIIKNRFVVSLAPYEVKFLKLSNINLRRTAPLPFFDYLATLLVILILTSYYIIWKKKY